MAPPKPKGFPHVASGGSNARKAIPPYFVSGMVSVKRVSILDA
jgi:hypothetical protein